MSQLFDLTGRIACVTGASGGLGQAAASLLARSGAKVVGIARRREGRERSEEWGERAAGVAKGVPFRSKALVGGV